MNDKLLFFTIGLIFISWNDKKFDPKERISMINESVWDIKAIYISEVGKDSWQENLLSDDVLMAGGGGTIVKAICGTYDIKIIDTDNHTCTVKNIDICSDSKRITITDQSIGICLNH